MAKSLEEVVTLTEITVEQSTVTEWVELGWVKASSRQDTLEFEEIDVARIKLICELHQKLGVGPDAVPVVLSLLDQLYSTRLQMRELMEAIKDQPERVQNTLLSRLQKAKLHMPEE